MVDEVRGRHQCPTLACGRHTTSGRGTAPRRRRHDRSATARGRADRSGDPGPGSPPPSCADRRALPGRPGLRAGTHVRGPRLRRCRRGAVGRRRGGEDAAAHVGGGVGRRAADNGVAAPLRGLSGPRLTSRSSGRSWGTVSRSDGHTSTRVGGGPGCGCASSASRSAVSRSASPRCRSCARLRVAARRWTGSSSVWRGSACCSSRSAGRRRGAEGAPVGPDARTPGRPGRPGVCRFRVAEDRGFEPLRAVNPTRFPSERHRPLGESSAGEATGSPRPPRNRSRTGGGGPGIRVARGRLLDSCQPPVRRYLTELPQGRKAARAGGLFRVHGGPSRPRAPPTAAPRGPVGRRG